MTSYFYKITVLLSLQSWVFVQLRIRGKNLKYWLFAIFGVPTLGAGVTQDEKTSLEQISRQKNSGTNWVSTLILKTSKPLCTE